MSTKYVVFFSILVIFMNFSKTFANSNYDSPCLAKVSDKSKFVLSKISTGQLVALMNRTEAEIRDFLDCSNAGKIIMPMDEKISVTTVSFLSHDSKNLFFYSHDHLNMTAQATETVDITKYYEDGDTYFIPAVLNRSSFINEINKVAAYIENPDGKLNASASKDSLMEFYRNKDRITTHFLQSDTLDATELANFELNGINAMKSILREIGKRSNITSAQATEFTSTKKWANHTHIFVKEYVVSNHFAPTVRIDPANQPSSYTVTYFQNTCLIYDSIDCDEWKKTQSATTVTVLPKQLSLESAKEKEWWQNMASEESGDTFQVQGYTRYSEPDEGFLILPKGYIWIPSTTDFIESHYDFEFGYDVAYDGYRYQPGDPSIRTRYSMRDDTKSGEGKYEKSSPGFVYKDRFGRPLHRYLVKIDGKNHTNLVRIDYNYANGVNAIYFDTQENALSISTKGKFLLGSLY